MIYNGVLQLVIYPKINARMGDDAFGTVLYFISVVSILGAGFGTGACYCRMVARRERAESNGDYNIFLMMVAVISVFVSIAAVLGVGFISDAGSGAKDISGISDNVAGSALMVIVLSVVVVLRYYAEVEYRMNIRFTDYFFFFFTVSVGYLLGLFIFYQTGISWIFVILLGEASGVAYTVIRGRIFRAPFLARTAYFGANIKNSFYISAANLISALILNSDRMLLRLLVGAREVTVFYVASLIGKMVALLTAPLNGVVISYFTGYDIRLGRKRFMTFGGLLLGLGLLAALVCTGISAVFVRIMYPGVFDEAKSYFFIGNLGQILYFLSGTLMVVLLSFSTEKIQMYINIIYAVSFAVIVIPAVLVFGLMGLAVGLFAVNLMRFLATLLIGFIQSGAGNAEKKE